MDQLEVIEETEKTDDDSNDSAAADSPKLYLEVRRANERTGDIIAQQDPACPRLTIKVGQRVHVGDEPCRVRRLTGELVILTPLKGARGVGKSVPKEKEGDASRGLRKARLAAQERELKRKRHAEKMEGQGGGAKKEREAPAPLQAVQAIASLLLAKTPGGTL
jgi:hypothetical protein